MKKPTVTMMTYLRQRRGLKPDDKSQDEVILKISPEKMVYECTAWELGDGDWTIQIAQWIVAVGASAKKLAEL